MNLSKENLKSAVLSQSSMTREQEILYFWFGNTDDYVEITPQSPRVKRWFGGDKKLDDEIRRTFAEDIQKAKKKQYEPWKKTAQGRLALTLLLDQFPRHVFRDRPESFAYDEDAQEICLKSIVEGWDESLKLTERAFFYLPLMHAEDLNLQLRSLKQYRILAEESRKKPALNEDYYFMILDYALKHHAIIERFGRFPYRNEILNRASTPEEIEYLKSPDFF